MKKTRENLKTIHQDGKEKGEVPQPHSQVDDQGSEAANVRYFLHALNQMSLALHALGYATEGVALAKVKVDLNDRLFNASGKITEIAQLLH